MVCCYLPRTKKGVPSVLIVSECSKPKTCKERGNLSCPFETTARTSNATNVNPCLAMSSCIQPCNTKPGNASMAKSNHLTETQSQPTVRLPASLLPDVATFHASCIGRLQYTRMIHRLYKQNTVVVHCIRRGEALSYCERTHGIVKGMLTMHMHEKHLIWPLNSLQTADA